jgi:hypothetical protein
MTTRQIHNAPTSRQTIDRYFLEHRAKLIDLAAFLDRIDRAGETGEAESDYRISALLEALDVLSDGRANRAGRILVFIWSRERRTITCAWRWPDAFVLPSLLSGTASTAAASMVSVTTSCN